MDQSTHPIWAPTIPPLDQIELNEVISLSGVLGEASALRAGMSCTFTSGTETNPHSGSECMIFVIEYADGGKCAFRLPYHYRKTTLLEAITSKQLDHWTIFNQSGISVVPKVLGSSPSRENLVGFPYIAYEWTDGKSLLWTDTTPRSARERKISSPT